MTLLTQIDIFNLQISFGKGGMDLYGQRRLRRHNICKSEGCERTVFQRSLSSVLSLKTLQFQFLLCFYVSLCSSLLLYPSLIFFLPTVSYPTLPTFKESKNAVCLQDTKHHLLSFQLAHDRNIGWRRDRHLKESIFNKFPSSNFSKEVVGDILIKCYQLVYPYRM